MDTSTVNSTSDNTRSDNTQSDGMQTDTMPADNTQSANGQADTMPSDGMTSDGMPADQPADAGRIGPDSAGPAEATSPTGMDAGATSQSGMDAGAGTTRSDWTTGAEGSQIPPWRRPTETHADGSTTGPTGSASTSGRGQLVRPREGRMIAGVGAGLADYLGVDRTIIRLILFILAFVNGIGIVAYIAGWLLLPEDDGTPSVVQRALNR